MKKMKTMAVRKMQQPGHYRPPRPAGAGGMNMPRRGRVGKQMPSFKQFTPLRGRKRRG